MREYVAEDTLSATITRRCLVRGSCQKCRRDKEHVRVLPLPLSGSLREELGVENTQIRGIEDELVSMLADQLHMSCEFLVVQILHGS